MKHPTSSGYPQLVFPDGFTERDEWEMERKGFVYAFLEYTDGTRHAMMFVDPVRLSQDVEATFKSGQKYYYEANLVVVPEVTRSAIGKIIPLLVAEGFPSAGAAKCEKAANKAVNPSGGSGGF